MPVDPSAVTLKIGLDVLTRVTPKGWAWVKAKWIGRDILVVGQARAGKTSLVRYIQHGVFAESDTKRTKAVKQTASFTVKLGREGSLNLEVRKAIDTVGQVAASDHADLTKSVRPHVVLLVIDMAGPWDGDEDRHSQHYIDEYLDYLGSHYRKSGLLRRKLKAIYVVANKRDKVQARSAAVFMKKLDNFVKAKVKACFDVDSVDVHVVESSLVATHDAGKSANAIIQKIALKLVE